MRKAVALILTSALIGGNLVGCKKQEVPKISPITVVKSVETAQESATNMANYYVYCILTGQYKKAWAVTDCPETTVFNADLLGRKFQELGIQPIKDPDAVVDTANDTSTSVASSASSKTVVGKATSSTKGTSSAMTSKNSSSEGVVVQQGSEANGVITGGDSATSLDDAVGASSAKTGSGEHAGMVQNSKGEWVLPYKSGIYFYGVSQIAAGTFSVSWGMDNQGVPKGQIRVVVEGNAPGNYKVAVPTDFLSSTPLKIAVAKGVKVFLEGAEVSQSLYTVDGVYVIPRYPAYDNLKVTFKCAPLPESTTVLNLATKATSSDGSTTGDNHTYKITLTPDSATQDSAITWLRTAIPKVLDTVLRHESLDKTTFGGTLSPRADKEAFRVDYMKCLENYTNEGTHRFVKLNLASLSPFTTQEQASKAVSTQVESYDELRLYVHMTTSVIAYTGTDANPYEVSNDVGLALTKENGQWKFLGFPDDFFRKISG